MSNGKPLFDNPEVSAMAAICEILQNLEDDAARLRVMHWAFGRFNPAFKRTDSPAPQAPVERRALRAVERPVERDVTGGEPETPSTPRVDADFSEQISELQDFFTEPAAKRLLR